MEKNVVTNTNAFNIIRCQVRANCGHVNMNFISLSFNFCKVFTFGRVRMFVFFDFKNLDWIVLNHTGRYSLRVVWFSRSGEVEQQLHLITGDIIYLSRLRKLRTSREVAIFCNFIIGYYIFSVRFGSRTTGNTQVSNWVVSRHPIQHLKCFNVPLHDFRRNEHRSVGISIIVKLGV